MFYIFIKNIHTKLFFFDKKIGTKRKNNLFILKNFETNNQI